MLIRSLVTVCAAALLLGACAEPQPQASPPPPPPAAPAPTNYMVFFDMGSSTLSAQAQNTLQQAAGTFKSTGSANVTVTGHTDTVGTPAFNVTLSQRRADAVKASLVKNGVPTTSITTVARGEAGLLVQTGDNVAEPQNRRVEISAPAVAAAPFDAAAYCKALGAKYRAYARNNQIDNDAAIAIAKCDAGDTNAGIPVLERLLTDAKVPLPPRS
jgi:hypothetical protein